MSMIAFNELNISKYKCHFLPTKTPKSIKISISITHCARGAYDIDMVIEPNIRSVIEIDIGKVTNINKVLFNTTNIYIKANSY